jgi:hypothetical protein
MVRRWLCEFAPPGQLNRSAAFGSMKVAHFISVLSFFVALSLTACSSKAPDECKQLCSLRESQQHQTFKNYPIEKQFDFYVGCGNEKSCMRESESPHDRYGQWMAEDNKAATFLIQRLKSERDERSQWDIIYVLRFMAVNGHLKGRRDIATIVNQVVVGMKGSFIGRLFGHDSSVQQSRQWAKEIDTNTL